jgi:hypothetical protein
MRVPCRAKGGRVEVTITAATFAVFRSSPLVLTPSRSSMPTRLCSVNFEFVNVSPEPFRPTTSP